MASLCRFSAFLSPTSLPVVRNHRAPLPLFRPRPAVVSLTYRLPPPQAPSRLLCVGSMETPPDGYRRNVGICLANPSLDKIFAASRLDIPGAWQMPQMPIHETACMLTFMGGRYETLAKLSERVDDSSILSTHANSLLDAEIINIHVKKGGIDEGEDPRNAAIRELREETGVTSAEIIAEVPYWLTYDFPPEVKEKLNKQWGTNWNGQAQKWFLFRFTGMEDEINLAGDGSERPEFTEWEWKTPPEVIEHAVVFKKPVYDEVLKVFAPHLQSDAAKEAQ